MAKRPDALTPRQHRKLREAAGLSISQLAELMDCAVRTVRNVEGTQSQQTGTIYERLLTLVTYPPIRQLIPLAIMHREQVLQEGETEGK